MKLQVSNTNQPAWRNITVSAEIPKELKALEEMSKNLWWVWNSKGKHLFRELDHDLWRKVGENPVMLLQQLSYERYNEILADKNLMDQIADTYADFKAFRWSRRIGRRLYQAGFRQPCQYDCSRFPI